MSDQHPHQPDEPKPAADSGSSQSEHSEQSEQPKPENPVLAAGKFASDQTAASVIAYLITGPALFGGIGWLLDRWLGTGFFVPVGLLAGMAMSLYIIWLRYGTQ